MVRPSAISLLPFKSSPSSESRVFFTLSILNTYGIFMSILKQRMSI